MFKSVFQFLKELYLTAFTLGFRFRAPKRFGGGWGPIVDTGKGVGFVSIIELVILTDLQGWIEFLVGTRSSFDSDRWATWAIALAFYLANYYILVTRGHGIKFEREFTHLKKSRKILLVTSCAVLLLATIAFSICSIPAYQRFFHL
jgi:hypothetical protein